MDYPDIKLQFVPSYLLNNLGKCEVASQSLRDCSTLQETSEMLYKRNIVDLSNVEIYLLQ